MGWITMAISSVVTIASIFIFYLTAPAGVLFINDLPTATIMLDGNDADWAGITPLITDEQGDTTCDAARDLKSVFLAKDNDNIYWKVETWDGTYPPSGFILSFQSGDSTSEVKCGIVSDGDGNFNERFGTDDYTFLFSADATYTRIGEVAEGRFPISLFDAHTIAKVGAIYTDWAVSSTGCDYTDDYVYSPPAPISPVDFTEGWSTYADGDVSFSPSETTVNINTSYLNAVDGYTWGEYSNNYSDAVGMIATFNVSSITDIANNEVAIGIKKKIGHASNGNTIQVEMKLVVYDQDNRVEYRVRERTPDGTSVKDYARGRFGNYSDSVWALNTDVTIGFAMSGQNISFYTPVTGTSATVHFYDTVFPDPDGQLSLYSYLSDNIQNQITATAKNVYILTAGHLRELASTGVITGDSNLDGRIGLEDVIGALRVVSGN